MGEFCSLWISIFARERNDIPQQDSQMLELPIHFERCMDKNLEKSKHYKVNLEG